jgi:gliding motility-associated-like protein
LTTIGDYAVNNPVGTNFFGYINEVRIWNTARTQVQLQTYMNAPLPNPTTQTGLQGYYTFDNLLNKQGNTAYNGTLNGGATINNTNPNCTFTPEVGSTTANAGTDTSFCSNGAVSHVLQGTGNGTYSWSPAIYLNNPNIQNPTATISATTTFYLTVTNGTSACTGIDSVTIYVNPFPLINTIADTTICNLSPLVLNTNSNAATYQWTPAAYVSNPGITSPNFIGANSQRLYVTGTTAGCSSIDSVDVIVNPLPVVQTINDTTLCSPQSITLTTTGAQTYSWSPATGLSNPNVASPVFSGTTQQTYTVTGTDAIGCRNTDIVTVFFSSPDSLKAPPSFTICGQQTIQLDGNNGTRVSYLWSPATYLSNATIINPLANPPQTTLYTLVVTDNNCGFDSTFTTLLTVLPAPVVNAGKSNDIDCANRSASLSASGGGDQYTWSPATGLSSTTIPNPVAKPAVTQKYIVQVVHASGCSNTDSVTVFVNNTASLARYMPNAFTPNGDGNNDCYGLKSWMYVQQLQFFIFNRYGEQVFGTANPNRCWDGMYKGKPAMAGAYVYVIQAKTACGLEEQKGSFLLLR